MLCNRCGKPSENPICEACPPLQPLRYEEIPPRALQELKFWSTTLGILTLLAVIGFTTWPQRAIRYAPGIMMAPEQPFQENLKDADSWEYKGFEIQPVAAFEMEGLTLLEERFYFGPEAKLAPVDLTFAWGPMSDQGLIDQIDFSHRGRFYYWRTPGPPPVPRATINNNVANMHLIPASDEILKTIKSVRPGDIVWLRGYLVNVSGDNGWRWRSSTTRKDSGAGACELIWVEEFAKQ